MGCPALPGFMAMLCCLYMGRLPGPLADPSVNTIFVQGKCVQFFQASNHTYQLSQTDFVLPRFNTVTHDKHSLRYHGPKLWSNLSSKRLASNLKAFKSQIKRRDLSSFLQDRYKAAIYAILSFYNRHCDIYLIFCIDFTKVSHSHLIVR